MIIPQNSIPDAANFQYMPYFYQSGKFNYSAPKVISNTGYSTYDFTSEPRYSDGKPQTVEQLLADGYMAIPTGDPVTSLITDKAHSAWLGLDNILSQVNSRHELYLKNIYEIERAKCDTINTFLVHADRVKPMQPDDRIYYSLNKNLLKLYEDQRKERLNLWRDISRLRNSLPETARDYLSAFRKVSVLNDYGGGNAGKGPRIMQKA